MKKAILINLACVCLGFLLATWVMLTVGFIDWLIPACHDPTHTEAR